MIGLYKKDSYLCKKIMFIMAVTFILLLGFGILWRSAYDYGNLASFPPEDLEAGKRTSEIIFPFLTAFLLCFQSSFLAGKSIELDYKNNFQIFCFSTKITDVELLEVLTAFGISCISAIVYSLVFGMLYGFESFGISIFVIVVTCVSISCILCVIVPLVYKHKNEMRAASAPLTFLLVLSYGYLGFLSFTNKMDDFEKFCGKLYEPIRDAGGVVAWVKMHLLVLMLGLVVIYVAFLAWCYVATLHQLKRREHVCGAS